MERIKRQTRLPNKYDQKAIDIELNNIVKTINSLNIPTVPSTGLTSTYTIATTTTGIVKSMTLSSPTATKVVSIISNVLIPEIDNGYNSNLSLTVTAPGVYQLNSNIPMFTNQEIVTITPILEADMDVYFYRYNLISTTQLQISVYAFFAGGNVNKDIRISINKITS